MDVSVIIPYQRKENIEGLINFIHKVNGDSNRKTKFIFVQNDDLEKYEVNIPNTIWLKEGKNLNSPYSARNRGLEIVKSKWVVFLDATCLPDDNWLDVIQNFHDDNKIYSANVKFYNRDCSIGNLYDSIVNIDNEKTVKESKVAKTACLAVPMHVVNQIGMFDEGIRSGGDVIWTKKCSNNGISIEFVSDWVVHKASRNTKDLLVKQFRVSKGWPNIWKQSKNYTRNFIRRVIFCWLPPNPKKLFNTATRRGIPLSKCRKIKLIMFGMLLRIVSAFGIVFGTINN